ncbi:CAF17-like 4Fe-4S cluster assembly/insertion protein YgfZ [Halovulum sp. GXIMD14793]
MQARHADRTVLKVTGGDASKFLQDLVTNDIKGLQQGIVYTALLTPQGKYLFDFFLVPLEGAIGIDVHAGRASALAMRLNMYKLRADVQISETELSVVQALGQKPDAALCFADPRHEDLGWRVYTETPAPLLAAATPLKGDDWASLRVSHTVPETDIELIADNSYILEAGFDRLNGVDFKKGCYVGQEVTARMRHKTELHKGLRRVAIEGSAPPGTAVMRDGKQIGTLFTTANGMGIAHLRFDRMDGELTADQARLTPL